MRDILKPLSNVPSIVDEMMDGKTKEELQRLKTLIYARDGSSQDSLEVLS